MYVSFILFIYSIYFDLYSLFLILQIFKTFRLRVCNELCVATSLLTSGCECVPHTPWKQRLNICLQQPATYHMTRPKSSQFH